MTRRRRRDGTSPLLMLLTLFFFLGSGCMVCWAGVVFMDPYGPYNPFPPPTLPPTVTPLFTPTLPLATLPPVPTATPTATVPPATPTPTLPATPTATIPPVTPTPVPRTPSPTPLPAATATFTPIPATSTPAAYPYQPQPGTPVNVSAQNFDLPCNWMGVVGQVLDPTGKPVPHPFFLLVEGTKPNGDAIRLIGYAGTASDIGVVEGLASGYIIQITDEPFNATQSFTIQLFDLENGRPLSPKVPFDTYADCERNAVLVNFVAVEQP